MDYYRSLDASTLDPDYPTFFELLASRQLNDLINPYIRYILVHYAQQYPQYLLRIVQRFDELYLVIFGLVEYAHLKTWNSSFVEKFYGLKRVNKLPVQLPRTSRAVGKKVDPIRRLTRKQVLGAVACSVLFPYLKEKLQVRFERIQGRYAFKDIGEDQPAEDAPLLNHWKYQADVALLKWFPRLTFVENSTQLLLCAFYLFRGSGSSSLADLFLNTRYSRITQNDFDAHEAESAHGRFKLLKRGLGAFGYALPTTLFGIKFLEWWNTSDFSSKLVSQGPELPPPQLPKDEKMEYSKSKDSSSESSLSSWDSLMDLEKPNAANGSAESPEPATKLWSKCPVCEKPDPETPAILETGVIYCYKCIWDYLQNLDPKGIPRCPATGTELLHTSWNPDAGQWEIGGIRQLMI